MLVSHVCCSTLTERLFRLPVGVLVSHVCCSTLTERLFRLPVGVLVSHVCCSTLTQRLFRLPVGVLARRLVRPLLARFVLLEPSAVQNVIPHLLQPAPGTLDVTHHAQNGAEWGGAGRGGARRGGAGQGRAGQDRPLWSHEPPLFRARWQLNTIR